MDADLSEFEAVNDYRRRSRCKVHTVLDELDDQRRDKLTAALASRHIRTSAIVRVVQDWGFDVTRNNVEHMRGGRCRCES